MKKSMTPAMQYRMSLNFDRLDTRKSEIGFACSDDVKQWVFVSVPCSQPCGCFELLYEKIGEAWLSRYGCELPNDICDRHVETTFATAISWMADIGVRQLSEDELNITREVCDLGNDFTLDILFLLVEGLGWTLGKPVPYSDPGWLAIWAEDEECGGYMAVVCNVLRMDYPEIDFIPDIVSSTYKKVGYDMSSV